MELIKKIKEEEKLLFLFGIVVYLPFMVNQLNNADGVTNGILYHGKAYEWENAQGRFFLKFFDLWRGRMIFPQLIIFVSLVILLISIRYLWKIFEIDGILSKMLIGCLILFAPSVANLFTYYYCADSYTFAYLLSILAAYILIKKQPKHFWKAMLLSVISLGIYQTYLGMTILLCAFWLIMEMLRNEIEMRVLLKKFCYFVAVVVGSAVLYLIIFKFLDYIGYLAPTDTREMDHMFDAMVLRLGSTIFLAYQVFFDYFFTDNIINNSWQCRTLFNIVIFVCIILLIIFLIIKNKVYQFPMKMAALLCSLLVLPVLHTIIVILGPGASVYAETGLLMLAYMNYFYIFMILLIKMIKINLKKRIFEGILFLPIVINLFIMTQFVGVFERTIELEQTKMKALAYQIEGRIESLGGYKTNKKVLVVGRPQRGNYPFTDDDFYEITKGMISRYSLIFGAPDQVSYGWIQVFKYFLGVNYIECSIEEREKVMNSGILDEMENFPDMNSVCENGDIIIVKLSSPY